MTKKEYCKTAPPSPITADWAGWKSNSLNTEPTIISISWLAHGTEKSPTTGSKSITERNPFIFVFSVGAARFPNLSALKTYTTRRYSRRADFHTICKGEQKQ